MAQEAVKSCAVDVSTCVPSHALACREYNSRKGEAVRCGSRRLDEGAVGAINNAKR